MLSDDLRELAEHYGVATDFYDWQGRPVTVRESTVTAVLAALGVGGDLSSAEGAAAALREARLARWRDVLPPFTAHVEGGAATVAVHVPHGDSVDVWVDLEDGGARRLDQVDRWVDPRQVDGGLVGEATFALPGDLPLGWHTLKARIAGRDPVPGTLVVTPAWLGLPDRVHGRALGTMVQLYQLRSRRSWGCGDLADLADLAAWSRDALGADFVLLNPLHAAGPTAPMEPSPYLPATRRFANPIYLRVEAVPEWAYLDGEDRTLAQQLAGKGPTLSTAQQLDRDASWELKSAALELVHGVPRSIAREASYQRFLHREGTSLRDYATWCALVEQYGPEWSSWPASLRDPHGSEVAAARDKLADRVEFHCWLQWLLDEQLAAVQRTCSDGGMTLGVMHDLAVGGHLHGADTWAAPDLFAHGISVGAPPDAFNQQGQDWAQPPWRPDQLARTSYAAFRDMVRALLRHAGGLRVDHVLGLFRLWWIPDGVPPDQGTYVRYDHTALVGILALEAWRAGAVVVGEDLGTVEPWVRDYLRQRGILGTSVLWFERDWDHDARPRRPDEWRELCLATVTTHDLPPTAGYLTGEHIRVRAELGLLTRPTAEEMAADEAERTSYLAEIKRLGLLADGATETEDVTVALHRYLTRTPSRLVGVSVADLVGERRAINQPGTSDAYPNWRLPLADGDGRPVLVEDLAQCSMALAIAAAMVSEET